MLGVIALQRQQYKKAISFIEKSISQTENPLSAQLSNLGEAYRRAGDAMRGRDLFRQAVELDPANLIG